MPTVSAGSRSRSRVLANLEASRDREVSRAEGKLAGAVRAFAYDFRGKVVLDIGSSTGGFTELALRRGAAKVVAVEKGTKQMKAPLRFDARVELYEKTDILRVFLRTGLEKQKNNLCGAQHALTRAHSRDYFSDFQICLCSQEHPFDVVLADVSFISLKPILLHAKKYLADGHTDFLVMLKPQFEASAEQLVKGVVKNEKMRRGIIKDFESWLKQSGFVVVKKRDNEVVGKSGNQERFYWLKIAK